MRKKRTNKTEKGCLRAALLLCSKAEGTRPITAALPGRVMRGGDFLNAVPRAGRTVCGAAFGNGPGGRIVFCAAVRFFLSNLRFPSCENPKKKL